ncbi:MAG TPA: hypothetical protein VFI29_23555 [Hanamia sp.]|nr:hypothetical protein [Hanamia sp.]
MYNSDEFVERTYYSLELKYKICKDHLEHGIKMGIEPFLPGLIPRRTREQLKIKTVSSECSFQRKPILILHQLLMSGVWKMK